MTSTEQSPCSFCESAPARWRHTAIESDAGSGEDRPSVWLACDICHILLLNGWILNLAGRLSAQYREGLVDLEGFLVSRRRSFVPLEEDSLDTGGRWNGFIIPPGWWLDTSGIHYWRPLDDPGGTYLHYLASVGDESAIAEELSTGADPNAVDRWHRTPLHIACEAQAAGVVRLLVDGGALPAVLDRDGRRPIDIALAQGSPDAELLEMLSIK